MGIVLCLVVFSLALLFATPSASAAPVDALTESQYEYLFSRWATTHRKQYRASDFFARYSTFKNNLDLIRTHNANPSASYTMAINRFGDLTLAEFKAQLGVRTSKANSGTRISAPSNSAQNSSGDKTVGRDSRCKTASPNRNGPRTLSRRDWREQGAVAPIRDQADCLSSGYAFAAVAAIEGEIAVQTGSFVPLSVAQPIDCSAEYGNHGCQGGHITAVLEYTLDRGLCPWSEYPEPDIRSKIPATAKMHGWNGDSTALGRDESNAKCACVAAARPWCYQSFRVRSVNDVLADAERTVLASGIAVTDGVRFYSSGVYDGEGCGEEPEQSVAVVGYDTDAEKPFYILRNSWGVGWGEEGYMRLALEEGKNTCGILTHTAYAEL